MKIIRVIKMISVQVRVSIRVRVRVTVTLRLEVNVKVQVSYLKDLSYHQVAVRGPQRKKRGVFPLYQKLLAKNHYTPQRRGVHVRKLGGVYVYIDV